MLTEIKYASLTSMFVAAGGGRLAASTVNAPATGKEPRFPQPPLGEQR